MLISGCVLCGMWLGGGVLNGVFFKDKILCVGNTRAVLVLNDDGV